MLTPTQLTTFKDAIIAETDPVVVAALSPTGGRDDGTIAQWYNTPTTQDVWRTAVPPEEYINAMVFSEMMALGTGGDQSTEKLRTATAAFFIFNTITGNLVEDLNASKPNVRNAMSTAFATAPNTLTALTAAAKRKASTFEMLYAIGGGATMDLVVEGPVTAALVAQALNS